MIIRTAALSLSSFESFDAMVLGFCLLFYCVEVEDTNHEKYKFCDYSLLLI